jgi:hypothetical protein
MRENKLDNAIRFLEQGTEESYKSAILEACGAALDSLMEILSINRVSYDTTASAEGEGGMIACATNKGLISPEQQGEFKTALGHARRIEGSAQAVVNRDNAERAVKIAQEMLAIEKAAA